MIINSKSKTKVNRMYQILKSCNGNFGAAKEVETYFTYEEMKIIYELRKIREDSKHFTPEEDELLCIKVNLLGPQFSKLIKYFHNKTASDLKRRYMKIKNLNNLLPFNKSIEKAADNEDQDLSDSNSENENDDEKSNRINQNNFESFLNRNKGQASIKSQVKPIQATTSSIQSPQSNLQFLSKILYQNSQQEKKGCKSILNSESEMINNSSESSVSRQEITVNLNSSITNEDEFIDLPPHKPIITDKPNSTYYSRSSKDEKSNSQVNLSNKAIFYTNESNDSDSIFKSYQSAFKFAEDDKLLFSDNLFKFGFNSIEENVCNDEDRIRMMRHSDSSTLSEFSNNISEINHQLEDAKFNSNINHFNFDDLKLNSILNGKMKFETVNNAANSTYFKVLSSSSMYSTKYENKVKTINKKEIYEKSMNTKSQIDSSIEYLCNLFIEMENTVQNKLLDLIEIIKRLSIYSSNFTVQATECHQDLMTLKCEINCLINKKFDLITRMVSFLKIKITWLKKLNEIF